MFKNTQMLYNTLKIFEQGYYEKNGEKIYIKLSKEEREECVVYLPEEIKRMEEYKEFEHIHICRRIGIRCKNMDSFSMAQEQYRCASVRCKGKGILVLNFANSVNPGGGVRRGARAQEEDLCRRSSLLFSLESVKAQKYYRYNQSLHTYLGSDALIVTPNVEVIKDANGELLDKPIIVSVMTCAAPQLTYGLEGLSMEQYQMLFYNRICGVLKCAAYLGYEFLVFGAFGCGAFRNDAKIVSDLFYKALKEFDYDGMKAKDFFRRIDFAVLDRTANQYNFNEFRRNFENFYREEDYAEVKQVEKIKREREVNQDKIRGSLFGGAVGDALGYPVEFLSEKEIFHCYGLNGITEYDLDEKTGKALISDDTQMTLFTANGLLLEDTIGCMRGICALPRIYVEEAYQEWLYTQYTQFEKATQKGKMSWLCTVPELYARRAPGNTCISALKTGHSTDITDYVKNPINNSKGCGGVMRIAPLALFYQENRNTDIEAIDMEAAQIAAITHGHSLGYMPAAVLCHIINRIVFPKNRNMSLKKIVIEAKETIERLFEGDQHLAELVRLIDQAVVLSENNKKDLDNIKMLGEGWVAEETLAIAIYCSLRYENDFSKGIIAAVNHGGDSDSTGAVTGNILGGLIGFDVLEEKWKKKLECSDVLLEIADDLCQGCLMSEGSVYQDERWKSKYW